MNLFRKFKRKKRSSSPLAEDTPNLKPAYNGRRNLRLARKFVLTFLVTFVGLCVVALAGFYFLMVRPINQVASDPDTIQTQKDVNSTLKTPSPPLAELLNPIPDKITFVIYGLDGSGVSTRSDTIMLGCFNTKSGTLDLVSIPRDIMVQMSPDDVQYLKDHGRNPPSSGQMLLNGVYAYAGNQYGPIFATKMVSNIFGVNIDYYVTVTTDVFNTIVDAMGGVEFDVPYRMYYNDKYQDLYIDLQPGMQLLNGKEAEGLVRFRDYDNTLKGIYTDYQRGLTQQEFIKAMITQLQAKGLSTYVPI